MPSKQPTPYDSIFDFIFASRKQKPKKTKPVPEVKMPELSGLAASYAEIATKPLLYPIETLVGEVGGEINNLGPIVDWRMIGTQGYDQYGGKGRKILGKKYAPMVGGIGDVDDARFRVRANEVSTFINDPRGYIDNSFTKYRAAKKWARFGAFTRYMSAAQFGIWSKSIGLDSATAGQVSSVMAGGNAILSNSQISHDKLLRTSINAISDEVGSRFGIGKDVLVDVFDKSKGQAKKADRLDTAVSELMTGVPSLSRPQAEKTASRLWGSKHDKDDDGLAGKTLNKASQRVLISKLRAEAASARSSGDKRKAKKIMTLISGMQNLGGSFGKVKGGPMILGQAVGKAAFSVKWFNDYAKGGLLFQTMLSGGAFSGGLGHIAFNVLQGAGSTKDKGRVRIWDSISGSYLKGADGKYQLVDHFIAADTPQGKLFSWLQYAHPVNAAKGLIWDGRIWKKLAFDKSLGTGGAINAKSAFYKLYNMMPKTVISKGLERARKVLDKYVWEKVKYAIAKAAEKIAKKLFKNALKGMAKKLSKMAFKEMIKKIIVTAITQIIGSTVPGIGNAVAFFIDVGLTFAVWVGEKLLKPFLELMALIVLGGIALILMFVFGNIFGNDGTQYLHRHLSPPLTGSAGEDIDVPVDWSDDPVPEHYDGDCPVGAGALRCTQGSHGNLPGSSQSVSSYHQKTRAVDFGLVGGTPVYAPHDGVITRSQSVSLCSDGTNYGGSITLRETSADGSGGYTWNFFHLQPSVSQGQTVSKGDLLGRVDGASTAEYSPLCWTGAHIHIHVQDASGAYLDSEVVLHAIGCNFSCH